MVGPRCATAREACCPVLSQGGGTLLDRLMSVAAANTGTAIHHVRSDGSEVKQSYAQLLAAARRAAGGLRVAGASSGDRVIVLAGSSLEFLAAFWGCLLLGAVPVAISAPGDLERESEALRRLLHVWRVLGGPLVVAPDRLGPQLDAFAARLRGLRWTPTSALAGAEPESDRHRAAPEDIALLQFSSGSTSHPHGVRLRHSNLIANIQDTITTCRFDRSDTMISWLPYSHDMGLIGFHLIPLSVGMDQVVMSPLQFMRNPRLWLAKITEHHATVAGCPNFALEYVTSRVLEGSIAGLDLSSLRLLFVGAEPVSAQAVRRFTAAAAPAGFRSTAMYPGYGLAEACLAVTLPRLGDEPRVVRVDRASLRENVTREPTDERSQVELVALGPPLPSIEVRIVDDAGAPAGPSHVGSVQVRGPSVSDGYEGVASEEFPAAGDGWLDTGDLGFWSDGSLVLTGRGTDVIFVNGEKIYPQDVEWLAAGALGVAAHEVAACGYHDSILGGERIALFVKRRDGVLKESEANTLRESIFKRSGLWLDMVFAVPALPWTTSGKTQRYRLREMLEDGSRPAEPAPDQAVEAGIAP